MSLPDAVIVVGASGFIGRNVVDDLCGRVALLIGINTQGTPVPGCDFCIPAREISDLRTLPARTAIVHVAAHRYRATRFADQQSDIMAANLGLTALVYRFASERGISEIRCASSSAVYPASWAVQDDRRLLDLNDWPHEREAPYAWSKRWGEITAELWRRRSGVHSISFRLTNPYGPHDVLDEAEAHVATAFVLRALSDAATFEIRGDPNAERDFVFSRDVAATFRASLELTGVDAAVNLAHGTTTRISDLAVASMRAAGRPRSLNTLLPTASANVSVKVRRATSGRLRELIPNLPDFHSLHQGLMETTTWYRNALR